MKTADQLKALITQPHPCSYLAEQDASTLFIAPEQEIDLNLYQQLNHMGFRRSGEHIYRPHCQHCSACISCRVVCEDFKPSRSQKRIIKRNNDLEVRPIDDINHPSVYALYEKYINVRHQDGDMYPASQEQYSGFIGKNLGFTHYQGFYMGEKLIAVAVIDELEDGWSAVYSFYDPFETKRGLGVFLILWQISACQQQQLDYLYLGYWVKNCQKMDYKIKYRPLELFINRKWLALS